MAAMSVIGAAASSVALGKQVLISRGEILSCHEASIKIGDVVSIGPLCVFSSRKFIHIGSNMAIASEVHIIAVGYVSDDPETLVIKQQRVAECITMENSGWIGSGSQILAGVRVGKTALLVLGRWSTNMSRRISLT